MTAIATALAYRPRPGPLPDTGPGAATAFVLAPAAVAFATSSPIVLVAAGAAAVAVGLLAGARAAVVAALRWGAALGALVVAVNAVVSQRGETILVRGWELPVLGRLDVSAEALAEGGVLALRIVVVLVAFAVQTASVDPDRLLRLLRPLARRSALTATLIVRMVPLAARDHARLREAAALRGPAAAPVDRPAIARRLVAGALDRAVDVAATLELRGYAAPANAGGRGPRRRHRHGPGFAAAAAGMVAVAVAARLSGAAGFDAYPSIAVEASAVTLVAAAAIPALATLPFALARRSRPLPSARAPAIAGGAATGSADG